MKTKEELNALKMEVEALNKKLAELNEDELAQVCGGEQRELTASVPQIDDNALLTFNGKLTNNGSRTCKGN